MKAAWLRWWPLALALAWLAATGWVRPLALPDEGRYIAVAWGMLAGDDWLVPRLNGLPYFHKPPLFYWITAASIGLFGPSEWAARLAPLLGAASGATALFLFARRWFGAREARLALLALATQPLVFMGGQYGNLDMLVAGCMGACILALAHAALLQEQGQRSRGALAAGYLFAALGVLAKGLIGLALPGLVLLAWLLLRRRLRTVAALLWLPGIALFLAVAGPWFVLMQQRFPEFGHYFFVVQHFARYAQGGFNNQQPPWFLPAVLALAALPWSAWLPAALRLPRDPLRSALRQLLWLWLAVVLVFFSLPQSKLVGYILPATLPLALLVADAFAARWPDSARAGRWWRASAVGAAAVCLLIVGITATRQPSSGRELGRALQQGVTAGDRVVFLHANQFDLHFYGRLRAPALMVDDWDDPALPMRDNWRKELADAGRFEPMAGRRLLVTPGGLPAGYCDGAATWLVGEPHLAARYPLLQGAERVAAAGNRVLWRVPGRNSDVSGPGCPGTPSANSADKS